MAAVKRRPGDYVLPLLALTMSFIGLVEFAFSPSNVLALLVSLLGVAACVLFFLGHKWSIPLLYWWIIVQIPAISSMEVAKIPNGKQYIHHPIVDTGQAFTLDVGLTLRRPKEELYIKVNLVPIALLVLYRLLRTSSLIGRRIVVKRFRKDNKLGDVFPFEGTVLRSATLGGEQHWLLVQLDRSLTYNGTSFACLLVRDKEGEIYKPGKAASVSYLVIVPEADMVGTADNRKEYFTFVDWGLVQVKR